MCQRETLGIDAVINILSLTAQLSACLIEPLGSKCL